VDRSGQNSEEESPIGVIITATTAARYVLWPAAGKAAETPEGSELAREVGGGEGDVRATAELRVFSLVDHTHPAATELSRIR
jgi:hypothetical protein